MNRDDKETAEMKANSSKTNEISLTWKRSLPMTQAVVAVLLMGWNTSPFAQSKPPSTAVRPAGAVVPTPTPTPTPTPRLPGSAPAAQPARPGPRGAGVPAAPSPTPGGSTAITPKVTAVSSDVSQMTSQQFRALPSTATLSYNGKSMTKAAFVEQRRKELRTHAKTLQTKADIKFKGARAQFQQQQTLDLAARNARVKAVAESYDRRNQQLATSPTYSALAREAKDIVHRYSSASPAERAKMKLRAAELHSQMQKMEQGASAGH